MSFDYDSGRIISGFRRAYGLDLNRVKLHWFEFLMLLNDLGDCALSGVIDIRTKDTNDLKGKAKTKMEQLKQKYALPVVFTREEQDAINKFFGTTEQQRRNEPQPEQS